MTEERRRYWARINAEAEADGIRRMLAKRVRERLWDDHKRDRHKAYVPGCFLCKIRRDSETWEPDEERGMRAFR